MPLIRSISGIRGTIGGGVGDALTPVEVVALTSAYIRWLLYLFINMRLYPQCIIVGRDARPSSEIISRLVTSTIQSQGLHVIDLGLSTTPTVSMAIPKHGAFGGFMITASHNDETWNGLKLFDHVGQLIDQKAAQQVFQWADQSDCRYAPIQELGQYTQYTDAIIDHIDRIQRLMLLDKPAIKSRKLRVVIDAVNSTGGIAVPQLLEAIQVADIKPLHCTPNGQFAHNPEPLPEHLTDLREAVVAGGYDIGLAVDPDVDRLVVIDETGTPWGEEYTLVAIADYVLRHTPGNTVSNLSSSQALKDITERHGKQHTSAPVGEQHVVTQMKATKAVIGGEGNGGVIYPALHYGRDALVGIALLLSYLASTGKTASALRKTYPDYVMIKEKCDLPPHVDWHTLTKHLQEQYPGAPMHTEDGIKLMLEDGWVHLRQSNTEPIVRLYAEANTASRAADLVAQVQKQLAALHA